MSASDAEQARAHVRALAAFRRKYECNLRVFTSQRRLREYVRQHSTPPAIGPDGERVELTNEAHAERKVAFVALLMERPESCEVGENWYLSAFTAPRMLRYWTMRMPGGIFTEMRMFVPRTSADEQNYHDASAEYVNRAHGLNHSYYYGIFQARLGRAYKPYARPHATTAPMAVYPSQLITAHIFLYQYGRRPGELHHLRLPAFAHLFKNTGDRTCDAQRSESAQLLRVLLLLAHKHQLEFGGRWDFVHCVLTQFLECVPVEPNGGLALELAKADSRGQLPLGAYALHKRPRR
jgi:hypothetical protein